jgi:ABC-2 type transport system permease protein
MIGALFFLIWNSWLNRLKMRVRRLKQPKYLIGAIFGGLYFLYVFGIRFIAMAVSPRHKAQTFITAENAPMYEAIAALILFGLILLAWVLPRERAALTFSEAEVAFLFPAPVSRRTLIHYKLVKSQVAILFMIFFLRIIFWSGGTAWVRALGWWVMLSTLNLHNLAASFARTMLLEHGISNWKRRTVVLALVGAAVAGVCLWAKHTIPPPPPVDFADGGMAALKYYFQEAIKAGPLPYLLYPFRLVVRPYFEGWVGSFGGFLMALWPALLIMAAHYWWVMRADVAFEEASVEASKKLAERVASMRANRGQWGSKPKKKKRAPFKLKPIGWPAVGLLWKNLIGAGSMFTWRFLLVLAIVMIPFGTSLAASRSTETMAGTLGFIAIMFVAMSFLAGPQMVRQDFRQDLAMADVLKTYPIKGWQMALGELLAPAVILTGFQWVLLIFAVSLMSSWERQEFPMETRLVMACSVAVIGPGLNLVLLLIPNGAVLLFPGWFQTGKDGPQQGIEAMGQRLIFMLGAMVAFVVALAPAVVLAVTVYFVGRYALGPIMPVPLAALAAAAVLMAEAGFGLMWLGRLFEKYDVAETSS